MSGTAGARYWIETLKLAPHPEGGHYREVYRSEESLPAAALPARFRGRRAFSTSIYFLLRSGEVSRLHRLKSDEVWHFYRGSPLDLFLLSRGGRARRIRLGANPAAGEVLQAVVPRNTWFGAEVARRRSYALVGCTLAPGFDFADFELGGEEDLLARYSRHNRLVRRLAGSGDCQK